MLENRTVVVTGAYSGIGAGAAQELQQQGSRVIGVDIKEPAAGVDRYVEADLSNPASIENAIAAIGSGVDALCNIAGVAPTAGATAVMKVNFLGLRALTLGMIEHLNDGASIVNMSSLAGIGWQESAQNVKKFLAEADFDSVETWCAENGIDDARCYFFSKEVLNVWTMLNRWTWRDRNIRINGICPGPVDTPILPDFIAMLGERAEEDMRVMDRPGLPTDIAPLVAFLCSDASQWIRGANLPIDGGMMPHILMHMTGLE